MSVTSQVVYQQNLRTELTHLRSGSTVITDAPIDNKGKGEKFSPTDLMATSLASCMITVMGIGAGGRGISFEHVSADVTQIMASNPRRIAEIHVRLTIKEDWNSDEKEIMERIANTCPVALSLHPDIKQRVIFEYRD